MRLVAQVASTEGEEDEEGFGDGDTDWDMYKVVFHCDQCLAEQKTDLCHEGMRTGEDRIRYCVCGLMCRKLAFSCFGQDKYIHQHNCLLQLNFQAHEPSFHSQTIHAKISGLLRGPQLKSSSPHPNLRRRPLPSYHSIKIFIPQTPNRLRTWPFSQSPLLCYHTILPPV